MSVNDVEQKAVQTFQENLLFFQITQPELYEKINALNLAIEKGYYEEKYSLEYKEGYFDVLDLNKGNFLYGTNSYDYGQLAAHSIDFTKKDNLFETFYNIHLTDKLAEELDHIDIEDSALSATAKVMVYSYKNAPKDTTTMKKLYKFIFVGAGLGTHISKIHEKLNSNVYFIIEDDLELFRLSLFVTNYKELTTDGAKLVFSVFDDEAEFEKNLKIFFLEHFIYNHYIKFFHMLSHADKKIKLIHNFIISQNYLTFNYSSLTSSILRPLEHLKNGYKFLNIAKDYSKTIFGDKPFLILGAGPSFKKNIEWLKQNHEKFIIVAVSALISTLEDLNIKPDIITHVHGFPDAMPHVEKIKDRSFFDRSLCLFGGFSYPDFLTYFKKENIFIYEGTSRYKNNYDGLASSNIGSLSFGLLLKMHIKEAYLLGLDFALNQETGQTHTDTHAHVKSQKLEETNQIGGGASYRNEILKIKGNFQEEVYTSLLFDSMKKECNAMYRLFYKDDMKIYNLSDGAYISDATPLHTDDAQLNSLPNIDKKSFYKDAYKVLIDNSAIYLSDQELRKLKTKVEYCNGIIDILQKHLAKPHASLNDYHYNLLGVFISILGEEDDPMTDDLNNIITMYLQFVSGYLFDLINTKEITNHKKLIKDLDKQIIPQIKKVITHIRTKLEDYLAFEEEQKE